MKAKERIEARRLRAEEGESIKVIAKKVGVSVGSVSLWVRDIELSPDQKASLLARSPHLIGSAKNKENARAKREEYQTAGRALAQSADEDYRIGCSLYWAEGDKSRNIVGMSNTDVNMLKFHVDFLRKYFGCEDDDFIIRIMAHLNNNLTVDEIKDYWLHELSLPDQCFQKFTLKTKYYANVNTKKNRHIYGCCTVRVCSTKIVQMIFGSIQEIFQFDCEEWIS